MKLAHIAFVCTCSHMYLESVRISIIQHYRSGIDTTGVQGKQQSTSVVQQPGINL